MAGEQPNDDKTDKAAEIRELKERALKLESELADAKRSAKNAPTEKGEKAWEKKAEELAKSIDEIRAELKALKPATPIVATPAPAAGTDPWD